MRKNACSIICLILLLASIVCLFLPCWTYEAKGETISISVMDYVSFPQDHKELTNMFREYTGEKKLTTGVALPLSALLVVGAAALIAGVRKLKSLLPAICGVVLGGLGLYICLTNIPLMLGAMRMPLMILYILMLVSGLAQMLQRLRDRLATE